MKFRNVVIIAPEGHPYRPDPNEYPNAANAEFPHLAEFVEDEAGHFVVAENGDWWPDNEFFAMVDLPEFEGEIVPERGP